MEEFKDEGKSHNQRIMDRLEDLLIRLNDIEARLVLLEDSVYLKLREE